MITHTPMRSQVMSSLLLAAFLVLIPACSLAADDGFVAGTGDVPLMAGLVEATDGALIFDAAAGRIVEVRASGPVAADAVLRFYDQTLPQLGWLQTGPGRYAREGEALVLDVTGGAASVDVRFILRPAAASR